MTDDDKRAWTAWAEGNWQGQEGMIMVAKRLCAQLRLIVVDGRFVAMRRHGLDARSQVAQIRMISNNPVQDKLAGLLMANDGTLPHAEDIAFTGHASRGSQNTSWMKYATMWLTNQLVPLPFQQLQFCMTCFITDQLTCVAGQWFGQSHFLTCSSA